MAGQVKGLAEDVANGKKAIAKAMDELKAQIERGQAKLGNIPADLAQQLATLTTESKANAHEIEALREIPLAKVPNLQGWRDLNSSCLGIAAI